MGHVAVVALWIWDARSSSVFEIRQAADHSFAAWIHLQAAMAVGIADHQPCGAHLVTDAPWCSWCLDATAAFSQIPVRPYYVEVTGRGAVW